MGKIYTNDHGSSKRRQKHKRNHDSGHIKDQNHVGSHGSSKHRQKSIGGLMAVSIWVPDYMWTQDSSKQEAKQHI